MPYGPYGGGAAYMGMMGHLWPMRESRGPSPYGAASHGMYGGGRSRGGGGSPWVPQAEADPRGYRAPSHTPRSSGLFSSLRSGGSGRGSSSYGSSSRSPYGSSFYGSGSPYSSTRSYSSYDSARSWQTDYRPRSGWFPGRRSGFGYPPFPSDFGQRRGITSRWSWPGR